MEKKSLVIIVLIMLLATPLSGVARAANSSIYGTLNVAEGSISISNSGKIRFNKIEFREFPSVFGKLPVKVVFFAVPPGCSVNRVNVSSVNVKRLGNDFTVNKAFPLLGKHSNLNPTNVPYLYWESGKMRKWNFVKLYYLPLYSDSEGLTLCDNIDFDISYKKVSTPTRTELADRAFDSIAQKMFVNYSEVSSLYNVPSDPEPEEHFDYLIITTSDLTDALKNFVTFKEKEGYKVKIVTTDEIAKEFNVSGLITPKAIRGFIKKHYEQWGVKYVLLIGDLRHLPMMYMYPKPGEKRDENGLKRPVGRTPTDFFYAELDSPVNADGDALPGEYSSDTKQMKDLYPDVFVGRIPFSDSSTVRSVLSNDMDYELSEESFRKSALLAGAMLYYAEEGTLRQDGGLALSFADDNYLKPAHFTTFSMYEKEGTDPSYFKSDAPLTESNFKKQIASGKYGLILWNAHGSPTSIARKFWVDTNHNDKVDSGEIRWKTLLSISDIDSIAFPHSVTYSASCETAWPEKHNMGFESLIKGGAAFIGASRISYGGGTIDPVLEGFIRHYALDNFALGDSLDLSLFEMPHSSMADFVNLYDFNLYGDPSLRVNPVEFAKFSLSLPENRVTVETGKKSSFDLQLTINSENTVKLGFETDLDGVEVTFDKNSLSKTGIVKCNVKTSPDMDPGDYTVQIFGVDKNGIKVAVPLHINVKLHKYEPYDLNKDGVIDGEDLIIFAESYGSKQGDSNFNPNCDFNSDKVIDNKDLLILSSHFGEKD